MALEIKTVHSSFFCNFCHYPAVRTEILEKRHLMFKIKIKCKGCGVEWSEWVVR